MAWGSKLRIPIDLPSPSLAQSLPCALLHRMLLVFLVIKTSLQSSQGSAALGDDERCFIAPAQCPGWRGCGCCSSSTQPCLGCEQNRACVCLGCQTPSIAEFTLVLTNLSAATAQQSCWNILGIPGLTHSTCLGWGHTDSSPRERPSDSRAECWASLWCWVL